MDVAVTVLGDVGSAPAPASAGNNLDRLLNPSCVAVIGASEAPGNRGGQAIGYLRRFSFAGRVVPVHPSGRGVFGYDGVRSLSELTEVPDVALIAVGARNVGPVIGELGRLGVGVAVVWAGGFAESGPVGAGLQRELTAAARSARVRLLGPNCLGLVNTATGFCGTFASWLGSADDVLPGHISMVTQSGGLGAAAHAASQRAGVGLRFMVSTGNEADISAVEMLEYFAVDPQTHVVCAYLEGVTEGRRLAAAFGRARRNGKEIVVLKGGRTVESARAVAAHTGALAGQARIWDAVLGNVGATQVYSLEEFVEVSTALASSWGRPPLPGRRVAILSYGGGSGVLAADLCVEAGLDVPPLSEQSRATLRPLVPEIASLENPIDLTPEAFNQERYRTRFTEVLAALETIADVDAVLLHGGSMSDGADATARAMCDFQRGSTKALSIYWPDAPADALRVFRANGVRAFGTQRPAVVTLGRVVSARARDAAHPAPAGDPSHTDEGGTEGGPDGEPAPLPLAAGDIPPVTPGQVLPEDQVHALLRQAGLPTLDGRLARTADEAVQIAGRIGRPVAMKVVSTQITHRAVAGLIRLNVSGAQRVRAAFDELCHGQRPEFAEVTGVYVQRMGPPGGTEFIVSLLSDEVFGPIASVGAGGVHTELLDDVALAIAPLSPAEARRLVGRLRIAGYLRGKRLDGCLEPLAAFLARFSLLADVIPWRRYVLELNPVLASPVGAVALDGLVTIDGPASQ